MCNHTVSPVDFAGLVPAPVLSIWSGVSVLPLEVKKTNRKQKVSMGVSPLNRIRSIFPSVYMKLSLRSLRSYTRREKGLHLKAKLSHYSSWSERLSFNE